MDVTADFVYCRLHGSEQLYASGYEADAIDIWTRRVVAWSRGQEVTDGKRAHPKSGPKRAARDVFVYFDNDAKVSEQVGMTRAFAGEWTRSLQEG